MNHYQILGISPNATDAEIKKARNNLCKKWHPDANPGREKEVAEMTRKIIAAYEEIMKSRQYSKKEVSDKKEASYTENSFYHDRMFKEQQYKKKKEDLLAKIKNAEMKKSELQKKYQDSNLETRKIADILKNSLFSVENYLTDLTQSVTNHFSWQVAISDSKWSNRFSSSKRQAAKQQILQQKEIVLLYLNGLKQQINSIKQVLLKEKKEAPLHLILDENKEIYDFLNQTFKEKLELLQEAIKKYEDNQKQFGLNYQQKEEDLAQLEQQIKDLDVLLNDIQEKLFKLNTNFHRENNDANDIFNTYFNSVFQGKSGSRR